MVSDHSVIVVMGSGFHVLLILGFLLRVFDKGLVFERLGFGGFKGSRWVVVGPLGFEFGGLTFGFELVKGPCGFSPRWVVVGRLGLKFGGLTVGFELAKGLVGLVRVRARMFRGLIQLNKTFDQKNNIDDVV
jgi:hypothetical protein